MKTVKKKSIVKIKTKAHGSLTPSGGTRSSTSSGELAHITMAWLSIPHILAGFGCSIKSPSYLASTRKGKKRVELKLKPKLISGLTTGCGHQGQEVKIVPPDHGKGRKK